MALAYLIQRGLRKLGRSTKSKRPTITHSLLHQRYPIIFH